MRKLLYIFISTCILSFFVACDDDEVEILSKGKMEDVLYDYHLAQGMMNMNDPKSGELIDAVFDKHGITEAEFDSSLVYYNRHAKDLSEIYDNLLARFEEDIKDNKAQSGSSERMASAAKSADNPDTTDIWSGAALTCLRPTPALNKFLFTFKADTSFYNGDRFILHASLDYIHSNRDERENSVVLSLSIRYKDGKTVADTRTSYSSGSQQLLINGDEKKAIEQVSGFFYYQCEQSVRSLVFIHDISLVRIHTVKNDSTGNDSITTDTLDIDSLAADSSETTEERVVRHRVSPDEMREKLESGSNARIRRAPAVRTPNSIGPRRKRINRH